MIWLPSQRKKSYENFVVIDLQIYKVKKNLHKYLSESMCSMTIVIGKYFSVDTE